MCYGKLGRLRFLSHLEVTHAVERGIRRAGLPYAVTQGFNPHMKIAFGPALPTGTEGEREYLDVWLTAIVPADQVSSALRRALPEDIAVREVRYVDMREPSLTAGCTIAAYVVGIEGEGVAEEQFRRALDALVAGGELTVEHKGKNKVFDLTRSLPKEPRVTSTQGGVDLELTTRMGQEGSLRPESLVSEVLSRIGVSGAVTRVTRRELLVETDEGYRRPI